LFLTNVKRVGAAEQREEQRTAKEQQGTATHWQVFGFADVVRAELIDGSNVPRLLPQRIGLGVDWDYSGFSANLTWIHASSHKRIAGYETPTPGYDLLNADLSYLLPTTGRSEWELFLKGHNLLNEDIRNSTSFLKDQAPQIGRNFVLGVRVYF
jgi:iron complex outermembrane receptor protein